MKQQNLIKPNVGHKIALYLRSATEPSTNSIEEQEKRLRAFVERANNEAAFGEVTGVYLDRACSGMDRSRIGLNSLLEAAYRREFSLVFVADVARLSRSSAHLCEIIESLQTLRCELIALNLHRGVGVNHG